MKSAVFVEYNPITDNWEFRCGDVIGEYHDKEKALAFCQGYIDENECKTSYKMYLVLTEC